MDSLLQYRNDSAIETNTAEECDSARTHADDLPMPVQVRTRADDVQMPVQVQAEGDSARLRATRGEGDSARLHAIRGECDSERLHAIRRLACERLRAVFRYSAGDDELLEGYAISSLIYDVAAKNTIVAAISNWRLCELWYRVCFRDQTKEKDVAMCIVMAFVRAGLPLLPPFQTSGCLPNVGTPLCSALRSHLLLADALLDLPPEYGLDANATNGHPSSGPPIAFATANPHLAGDMYERLLDLTAPATINGGRVLVDRSWSQYQDPRCHVLVSLIFQCTTSGFDFRATHMQKVRAFLARAVRGGPVDLTSGIAHSDTGMAKTLESHPSPRTLWPHGEYRGPLVLMDTLCDWHVREGPPGACGPSLCLLREMRTELVATLRHVCAYPRDLETNLELILNTAAIHMRYLHTLIATYILTPIRNPSHLVHPLLQT